MAAIVWTYIWFNFFTTGVGHCVVSIEMYFFLEIEEMTSSLVFQMMT